MEIMKQRRSIATAVLASTLVAGLSASADPVLTISDGVTTVGPITLTGGSGTYTTNIYDSSWSVVVATGESKPVLGTATDPNLELDIQAASLGSANALTLTLSDNGFGPTLGSNNVTAALAGQPAGGSGDVVTFNTYYDTNNVLDALTSPLTQSGSLLPTGTPTPYFSVQSSSLSLTGPYSLTEVVTIAGGKSAIYSLLANLQISNQPCTCSLSFACPADMMICESDSLPDPNLEASNIVATDTCLGTVPVKFMGATTNGTCPSPSIVTYTFGATDGCGHVYTCSQHITINCQSSCNITTVSNAIVGTSNLTASVANAGTGATYAWTVNNGTITAGQGTASITYTAGNDTNNPVSVCVTVTSAAGCSSSCCASVKLTPLPPPPGTNVGKGDTATIGFWQNKNGQAIINGAPNSPALGNWLAANLPCLFGYLAGDSDAQVAADYVNVFKNGGSPKTLAQIYCGALACYFTSTNLGGGSLPAKYGFNQSPGGTGNKLFNVGTYGTAIGLQNNTSYTVLQLLQAANKYCPLSAHPAAADALNNIFSNLNQGGDI